MHELLATFGYGALGCLCLGVYGMGRRRPKAPSLANLYPALWLALGVLLLLFAFQRATGLLGEVTDALRTDAKLGGWYGTRRELQRPALQAALAVSMVLYGGGLFAVRRAFARHALLVTALAYLAAFAAVQLISLHATDAVLRTYFGPLRGVVWLDLFGLALAAAGALLPLAWNARRSARRPLVN